MHLGLSRVFSACSRSASRNPRPRGTCRILVLGDSFTWGFGVDDEERFSNRLQMLLGSSCEVLNAGVTGYGTDQEMLFFRREGRRYNPDIVLLEFGTEDVINNGSSIQYTYPKPFFLLSADSVIVHNVPVPKRALAWDTRWDVEGLAESAPAEAPPGDQSGGLLPVSRWLDEHLLSYRFVHGRVARLVQPGRAPDRLTRSLLLALQREVTTSGGRFVIAVIPYKYHFAAAAGGELREWIQFLHRAGIPTVDVAEAIAGTDQERATFYLQHDDHWNARGHDIAARTIARFLRDSLHVGAAGLSGW